jgi:hypothetical protein
MTCPQQDGQLLASVHWRRMGGKVMGPSSSVQSHNCGIIFQQYSKLMTPICCRLTSQRMAIQDSINSWWNLLIATGGVFQPEKCCYSIVFFKWTNGVWHYMQNALVWGEFGITVPLPGGSKARISHKPVNHLEKTLGAMTLLDSNISSAISMMQEKAQWWINATRNGHLHCCNVCLLLKIQFFHRISYGLCSFTATFQELKHVLHCKYYQILPLGGIVHTTSVRSRTIDAGFFGVGLSHLGVEALITMSNKLLIHYGCQMTTGEQLGFMVTHSWFKMLWEKYPNLGWR